jgi:hypothetical protein
MAEETTVQKVRYCCRFPNLEHFQDTNGGKMTAVVFCSSCQQICSEIWMDLK